MIFLILITFKRRLYIFCFLTVIEFDAKFIKMLFCYLVKIFFNVIKVSLLFSTTFQIYKTAI